MAKKEEQLKRAFKIIIKKWIECGDIDIENYYNTLDIDIDRLVNELLKEVSIRVYIGGE